MFDDTGPGRITSDELASQPAMWAAALAADGLDQLPADGEAVLVVGCGTSWYIGDAYAQLRNDADRGRTRASTPAELAWIDPDEHVVVISRSGRTADVVELVRHLSGHGSVTAVLGDSDSELGALCRRRVDLGFADERSIVQTRFATTALTALRASIGAAPPTLVDDGTTALRLALPAAVDTVRQTVFLGHRWTVGLAHEAALKLREMAGVWTESYPVHEYQHGPISCAGAGTLVWALGTLPPSVAADVAATGALVYHDDLDPQADLVLVHRLGLAMALANGRDPDRPPHLNRAVLAPD